METELEFEIVYDYVDPVNSSLECAICRWVTSHVILKIETDLGSRCYAWRATYQHTYRNPFVEPIMSPVCQHVFCRTCVTRAIELSPTCPIDRSRLELHDLVPAPRIVQQMVDELRVTCPRAACARVCERALLHSHLKAHCLAKDKSDVKGKRPALAASTTGSGRSISTTTSGAALAERDDLEDAQDVQRHCRMCSEIVTASDFEASPVPFCPHDNDPTDF